MRPLIALLKSSAVLNMPPLPSSVESALVYDMPPGHMTHISQYSTGIQHQPLLCICTNASMLISGLKLQMTVWYMLMFGKFINTRAHGPVQPHKL